MVSAFLNEGDTLMVISPSGVCVLILTIAAGKALSRTFAVTTIIFKK
jgi:hypothetical protein